MNKIVLKNRYIFLAFLLCGFTTVLRAQSDDFTTWTTMKVNYKLDPKFTLTGALELRTEDDVKAIDRWGLALSGSYDVLSFLKLEAGYETHYRNLGEFGWKFRHRYRLGATASYRWQWLNISLRERFQQTFDQGNVASRLRSRLKVGYKPSKGIVSPYFSIEIYQNLGDAPFWRADRMRYRPGIEIALAKAWSLDAFYCYQYEKGTGKNVIGLECGFTF